jgi:HlyD family secretion protein
MKRLFVLVAAAVVIGVAAWSAVPLLRPNRPTTLLYGNVEIRQVDVAFNSEGTITSMLKHEGDRVKTGEVIAALDDATYRNLVELTQARRDAAQAALTKLLNGSRPEDIEQARAAVANAKASVANAQVTFLRQQALVATSAVSRQAFDDAQRMLDSAVAQYSQNSAALAESVNGPRVEDIDTARAQLRAADSTQALATTALARAQLKAPSDGVVMTRVTEPGTVVVPGSVVYSIALTSEVWVRAFVPETLLARAVPDAQVRVLIDGRPDHPYAGRIGYVSPSAEFTPKTVETPELRTQLVYRIRIRITDADDAIRQGQPVTIDLGAAAGK